MVIFNNSFSTLRAKGVIKTYKDFADILGTSKNSISAAKKGDEKYLTESLISKIQGITKELERVEMNSHEDDKLEISGTSALVPHSGMKCVPTIPIHAYNAVNFDVMEYFAQTDDDLRLVPLVMQFPGTDCYYFVNSEDMSPNLRTNDLLCLSRLPDDAKVTNGDICVLNTKYQGILERFVYDEDDFLLLKSTQSRWTDMRVPKSEVFNIFRILGAIRTNI